MTKRFFVEMLPLCSWDYTFHELGLIVDIDHEVKCAYHFKLRPENHGHDDGILLNQGYDIDMVRENPMTQWETCLELHRIIEKYVNKAAKNDKFLFYSWDGQTSFLNFKEFMRQNGVQDIDRYFFQHAIEVRSLLLDKCAEQVYNYEPADLRIVGEDITGSPVNKDALSLTTASIRIYNGCKV